MDPIRTLYEREEHLATSAFPPDLRAEYGSELHFPLATPERVYVAANFVSTLDGVVSFDIPGEAGGSQISGSNEADRFIMGLLRASVDADVVGAGTVDATSPAHLWTAEFIYPAGTDVYSRYRQEILRNPRHPLSVVVSGSGRLDLNRSMFHTSGIDVLIITTELGRHRLIGEGADRLPSTRIAQLPAAEGKIDARAILNLLKDEFGVKLLLHEGGPTLLGNFLAVGLVDELFLTIAPQLAGRTLEDLRPGLVANVQFDPSTAPWLTLLSVKQQASHLYLRYRKREL